MSRRLRAIAPLMLAVFLSACARPPSQTAVPVASATPSSPAWQRAFHLSFRKHYRSSFLQACNQPRAFGARTPAYCACVQKDYDKTFNDTELTQLGVGTASATTVQRGQDIVDACKRSAGAAPKK